MFVSTDLVAVSDEKGNTIWILEKMGYGAKKSVEGAMMHIDLKGNMSTEEAIGEYQKALMHVNIKRWEGPDFDGVACNKANIYRLDPDEPIVQAVEEEIARRNKPRAADPNLKGAGSNGWKASSQKPKQSARSTSKSS